MEILSFDESVDLLRRRLHTADAINASELHGFKELMRDHAEVLPDHWYWQAFEELKALGHLDQASRKLNGRDACGRLNAVGRWFMRSQTAA